jgi:hypothetical protein
MEMTSTVDLARLTMSDFSQHLEEVFEMRTTGGVVPLKLATVEWSGQSTRDGGAFSLSFVAPAGPWQPQAIYPLAHPRLGTIEIFLVPIGPITGGNGYHAAFG